MKKIEKVMDMIADMVAGAIPLFCLMAIGYAILKYAR
jgi:hypothetical protein